MVLPIPRVRAQAAVLGGALAGRISACSNINQIEQVLGSRFLSRKIAMVGTTVSHFRILEKLGEGGMGAVYRARDTKLDRDVALKFLAPELTRDPEAKARFAREARAASSLQHDNICTIHAIDETEDGHLFIVMDLYGGESLKETIQRGPLRVKEATEFAIQIGQGLAEAHQHGIVHRDIKPANVLIARSGVAKVVDFGVAKLGGRTLLTRTGSTVGTIAYMAPEQAFGEDVDGRADIWSLGVVLYEMLSGRLPFRSEYQQAIMYSILNEEPESLRIVRPDVPLRLVEVADRALKKDPQDRFQSIEEMLSDLRSIRKSLESEKQEPEGATGKTVPSIAVLPFVNMSPDRDNEYFSDGLAEEIINALSKLEGLFVTARTSAFQFRGKELDIREIGRQLNVRTVLEGSVRKEGKRLRITAQLINVADGYHLWSERFDRNIKDVFAVQDEIAMAVVGKLRVELLEGEEEKVTKRHTQDEEAYRLYLKGRYYWNQRVPRAMVKAVEFFQHAIDRDPRYAPPYVGIADVFNMLGEFGFVPPHDAYTLSRSLLQKAREIDDSFSDLYTSLALITYCFEWDLPLAEQYARRSIELNPQSWYAHATRGEILGTQGRSEEGFEEARKALELDPLSPMVHAFYGIMLAASRRIQEARDQMQKAIAMESDQPMLHYFMGQAQLMEPVSPEGAIPHLQKAFDLGATPACGFLGVAYALAGDRNAALGCLAQLERIERERFLPLHLKLFLYFRPALRYFRAFERKYVPPYLKGIVYAALNMHEESLAAFEASVQARDYLLPAFFTLTEFFPWCAEIRNTTRFQTLRAKVKVV
jgi:serine/threonine protein kinase